MAKTFKITDKIIDEFHAWYDEHPYKSVYRAFAMFWETTYKTKAPHIATISKRIDPNDFKTKTKYLSMPCKFQFQALPDIYEYLREHEDIADELINTLLREFIKHTDNNNDNKQN